MLLQSLCWLLVTTAFVCATHNKQAESLRLLAVELVASECTERGKAAPLPHLTCPVHTEASVTRQTRPHSDPETGQALKELEGKKKENVLHDTYAPHLCTRSLGRAPSAIADDDDLVQGPKGRKAKTPSPTHDS